MTIFSYNFFKVKFRRIIRKSIFIVCNITNKYISTLPRKNPIMYINQPWLVIEFLVKD